MFWFFSPHRSSFIYKVKIASMYIFKMRVKEQYSMGVEEESSLTLTFSFSFLLSLSFCTTILQSIFDAQALNASLPAPGVSEDNLKDDASPQEPLQLGAVTASKEPGEQQSEVASLLQEPPGEQTESAGANGEYKRVFSGHTIEACMLNGMRSRSGA